MAAPLRAGSLRRSSARRQPLLRPDDALARALRAPSERRQSPSSEAPAPDGAAGTEAAAHSRPIERAADVPQGVEPAAPHAAAPAAPAPAPSAPAPSVEVAPAPVTAPAPALRTAPGLTATATVRSDDGPRAQLEMALTDLAEVFAVYPFRSGMPACAHCVSDDDLRLLGRAPGRIPASVLERYVTKSMITWGDAVDLKRLLPEVLRRTCAGEIHTPEALLGARIRRAGWLDWPAAEAPAVRRTLRAAWLTTLAGSPGPGRVPATTRLGLIVSAEDDLSPYLDLWEDRLESPGNPTARLHAVLHLAELLAPLAHGGRRRLSRSYPLARRGVVGQLDQWLRLPVVVRRLAHAADALADTPQGAQVALAREGLARLKTER